jgi:NAD(P)-dependent dehydrogenase (short-subunit alcohol dehydrogenase family)
VTIKTVTMNTVMMSTAMSGRDPEAGAEYGRPAPVTDAELEQFSRLVGKLRALPVDDPVRLRAEQVAASFSRDGRRRRRSERRQIDAAADRDLLSRTALGAADRREDAPLPVPETHSSLGAFNDPRRCYICKEPYREADSFYHRLCPDCAARNADRRGARTDLAGRRALLTGGRVKIGFQLALMLLRDGAQVTVTSRFPHDAAARFRDVADSADWLDRLTVAGIDLRDPRQVIGLCDELAKSGAPLDILINNAAQTVRRAPESYARLVQAEHAAAELAAAEQDSLSPGSDVPMLLAPGFRPFPALASAWPVAELENAAARPIDAYQHHAIADIAGGVEPAEIAETDEAGLLPDPAPANSWSARLGELDPAEVLETQLVNAIAPALLCDRLLPLLLASPHPRRYIVNVTAVEGRFAVRNKTSGHPHTNMAKAALNMLTRTSAQDLAERGVYLCAVDTGWITDENPAPKKAWIAGRGFRTPLDVVDGAARVYDPIVRGEAGNPVWGVFLKDYREAAW